MSSPSPLAAEACIACGKDAQPLSHEEAQALLTQLPGWELAADGKSLRRRIEFRNFRDALAFVNKLGEIAEAAKHHPDIAFGWGYAEIVYTTHSLGGLHRNDFILAARTGDLLAAA